MKSLCGLLLTLLLLIASNVAQAQEAKDAKPEPAAPAAAKKPSFDSAGVPIHYLVTGNEDGEPVVLIHGFASSIEAQWPPAIEVLKKDYKVIALDIRGCGGSGNPHDSKMYGIEMVNDVVRLLDHLKIDKAHIVGYSMSAGTGLLLAVHHAPRVRSLACCGAGIVSFGSNTLPGNVPNPEKVDRNPGAERLLTDLAKALDNNSIEPLTLQLTPANQPKPTSEQIKAHDKALLAVNDNKALAALIRASGYKDTRLTEKEIQGIQVPTLAIVGADDPLKFGVDKLKALLPKTKVVVIENAHHLNTAGRPEFATALKQFLNENRQPAKNKSLRPGSPATP
jgi:pimeloyl-ACP methyl ester carboxylesterase